MQACESAYSSWKFSGGFRTWVKMSLGGDSREENGREAVEFRQEVGMPGPTLRVSGSTLESCVQGSLSEGSASTPGS